MLQLHDRSQLANNNRLQQSIYSADTQTEVISITKKKKKKKKNKITAPFVGKDQVVQLRLVPRARTTALAGAKLEQ